MTANKFHNMSDEALADEYGTYKQRADALAEHLDALKNELKQRYTDEPIIGNEYEVTVSVSKPRVTLDAKRLKADLGEEIIAAYETVGEPAVSLRVKQRKLAHLENIGGE
jgi:vancomycin resistance protein YoaR